MVSACNRGKSSEQTNAGVVVLESKEKEILIYAMVLDSPNYLFSCRFGGWVVVFLCKAPKSCLSWVVIL